MQERKTEHEQLPLEHALGRGASLMTILELMAQMGDSLASFRLTDPLSSEANFLNQLLLVCVLRGDAASAKKALSWGADMNAVLTRNMPFDVIFSLADKSIMDILLRKIAKASIDFVSYSEKKSTCSNQFFNRFELCIIEDEVADSKTATVLTRDAQIYLLLKYNTIRMIVKTLVEPLTNEGISCLDGLKVFLARPPEETMNALSRLPDPTSFSVFSTTAFFSSRWREPAHLIEEDPAFQASLLKTMGI